MAVESLFNASRTALLQRARISTADDVQTLALVDQSINEVRIGFYRRLGSTRVNQIVGYSLTDNPASDEELIKSQAAATEALWLTWLLAQRLPHLFMDNRASAGDAWSDEQLTRDTQVQKAYLNALKAQVDEGLASLEEPVPDALRANKCSSITNDEAEDVYASGTFKGLYPNGVSTTVVNVT